QGLTYYSPWNHENVSLKIFAGQKIRLRYIFNNISTTSHNIFNYNNFQIQTIPTIPFNGVENVSKENFYAGQIYPNPSSSVVNLQYQLPGNLTNAQLKIFDLNGREIACYPLDVHENIFHFDVSTLTNGIYFYRIISGEISSKINKIVILK
ncbi:MAG: T9SS type A sorting domain-containing protein, partial [Bacteroidia bacterium]